jgi:hypothetical protein
MTTAAKPRNQTRDQFARGCRNVCGKPPAPTGPGRPFKRLHDDILIGTTGPDGERDVTAVYVGRDARWVVFRKKAEKVRRKR